MKTTWLSSTDMVDDAQELAAYRRGDTAALGRLVAKYQRPLFAFISRFAANPDEANEWFQETWIRAIRNMNFFRQKNLPGWLFRIAHNLAIDAARRRKPVESLDAAPPGAELPAPGLAPDAIVAGRDLGQHIAAAVNRLPFAQREVFWLRMDAQLPFREIARLQRCSLKTALGRMQYALARLRAALGPAYRELQDLAP